MKSEAHEKTPRVLTNEKFVCEVSQLQDCAVPEMLSIHLQLLAVIACFRWIASLCKPQRTFTLRNVQVKCVLFLFLFEVFHFYVNHRRSLLMEVDFVVARRRWMRCCNWVINRLFSSLISLQTHSKSKSHDNCRDAWNQENRWKHKASVKCEISRGFRESEGEVDAGEIVDKVLKIWWLTTCFLQVADDPETLRIKQNTKNISNVAYHGDIQKKAAMERQREMNEIVDNRGESSILGQSLLHE